jgi:hypothetical protein
MAHASLSRQMDHHVGLERRHVRCNPPRLLQHRLGKGEAVPPRQKRQPRLFQRWIIVGRHPVEPVDLVALVQQQR